VQLLQIIAILGLVETAVLFSYAARYYMFSLAVVFSRKKHAEPKDPDLSIDPFVSVMLPVYNEPNVIDRLLTACTSFDYPDYEVIVTDDYVDETTAKLERWSNPPRVRVIHRSSRTGWKAGH
jgi:cellulose synthase/poly-beta-1,6-N-acetylglucosamine synthase-like glycosyltransferase